MKIKPDYKNTVISANALNSDIVKTLNKNFANSLMQTAPYAVKSGTAYERGRAIWNFLRNNVKYRKDEIGKQVIQLPARLLVDTKSGDCKSLALAAVGMLANSGFKNVRLRYTSYVGGDETPTHVYAVGSDAGGRDYIVDAVHTVYNDQVPFKHKIDYPMELSVLSGFGDGKKMLSKVRGTQMLNKDQYLARLKVLVTKLPPGGLLHNVVLNAIGRLTGQSFPQYSPMQLARYAAQLKARTPKFPILARLRNEELQLISRGGFTGNVVFQHKGEIAGFQYEIGKISLKKIGKGIKRTVKKVSLKNIAKGIKAVALVVPRKAFLAMVALNVRGIAKRLSQLSDDKLKKIWVDKFAGKLSVLKSAISNGKNKKPVFGASKKVRAIKGIGFVIDDSDGIGFEPATTAAIISAGSAVLIAFLQILKGSGVPEVPENAAFPEEPGDFPEADSMARGQNGNITEWVQRATDIATATGIIPERPLTQNEERVNAALGDGTDYDGDGTGDGGGADFSDPKILLTVAAGVGVAYYAYTHS